MLPRIERTASM